MIECGYVRGSTHLNQESLYCIASLFLYRPCSRSRSPTLSHTHKHTLLNFIHTSNFVHLCGTSKNLRRSGYDHNILFFLIFFIITCVWYGSMRNGKLVDTEYSWDFKFFFSYLLTKKNRLFFVVRISIKNPHNNKIFSTKLNFKIGL